MFFCAVCGIIYRHHHQTPQLISLTHIVEALFVWPLDILLNITRKKNFSLYTTSCCSFPFHSLHIRARIQLHTVSDFLPASKKLTHSRAYYLAKIIFSALTFFFSGCERNKISRRRREKVCSEVSREDFSTADLFRDIFWWIFLNPHGTQRKHLCRYTQRTSHHRRLLMLMMMLLWLLINRRRIL